MFAAAGILVPVVIHLWNTRRGRILKVGSTAFLAGSAKTLASSLKLGQLLLLIVRCLLVILLALLFTRPRLLRSYEKAGVKGWMLAEKNDLPQAYNRYQPLMDSLTNSGYEFHYLNRGFEKAGLTGELKRPADSIPGSSTSFRVLIKQLATLLPADLPIHVFTSNYLSRFDGNLEPVSLDLHWHTFTPTDSVYRFILQAYSLSADSIRVVMGETRPAGTFYSYHDLGKTTHTGQWTIHNSGLLVSYDEGPPVPVDTGSLKVTIFTDKYFTDAKYVLAAITAVQQTSKRKMRVYYRKDLEAVEAGEDWVFWLSNLRPPVRLRAGNIFQYQAGEVKSTNSRLFVQNNAEDIPIYKQLSQQDKFAGEKTWADGFGNPVLGSRQNAGNILTLYTHLDPSWTGLPWDEQFPLLIYSLLFNPEKTGAAPPPDKRAIPAGQMLPLSNSKQASPEPGKLISKDLSRIFWIVAFIVFCMERYLALRTRKEVAYA
jgi:hypothetical protein